METETDDTVVPITRYHDDEKKPRPSLVPWDGFWRVVAIAEYGAKRKGQPA
jgi:hypothetical protein